MAKEVALSKRIKISEAQQHMILAVLGASVVLGASISLISHFYKQITFNAEVIMAEDESITNYSNIIKINKRHEISPGIPGLFVVLDGDLSRKRQ